MKRTRVLRWILLDALMVLVIVIVGLWSHTSGASVQPPMGRGRLDQKQVHQVHDLVPSAGQILTPIGGEW